jgi:hypothetical protein
VVASLGDADILEAEKTSIAGAVTRRLRGADSGDGENWFEPDLSADADAAAWVARIVALEGRAAVRREFGDEWGAVSPSFLLPAWHPYKTRACVAKALQSRRSFQFRLHRWAGPFPIDPEYLVDPALLRVWQARLAHRHDPSVLQRQPGAH